MPVLDLKKAEAECFYLPMHGVVKESSTTTKLRIVFDATSGSSLNDFLLQGPNRYPLLTTILLQFRQHLIGMAADISKIFREVGLHSGDRDLHRFLMRNDTTKMLEEWRMTRLTFGVTCSPFLATQVLRQLAEDHNQEHSRAADIIRRSFYVDDCLTGASSLEEASDIRKELNLLLDKAGMTLRKWRSNSIDLLETIPEVIREMERVQFISAPAQCHKILGVHWHTVQDTLHVATPILQDNDKPTKRQIASDVARTFDVLGWFSPVTIKLKIVLQRLWGLQVDWDQDIPPDIFEEWRAWRTELQDGLD